MPAPSPMSTEDQNVQELHILLDTVMQDVYIKCQNSFPTPMYVDDLPLWQSYTCFYFMNCSWHCTSPSDYPKREVKEMEEMEEMEVFNLLFLQVNCLFVL